MTVPTPLEMGLLLASIVFTTFVGKKTWRQCQRTSRLARDVARTKLENDLEARRKELFYMKKAMR